MPQDRRSDRTVWYGSRFEEAGLWFFLVKEELNVKKTVNRGIRYRPDHGF